MADEFNPLGGQHGSALAGLLLHTLLSEIPYELRKIGRTEASESGTGIGVSTVITKDVGFESAIMDKNGAHPVERYKTKEEAELGHKDWSRRVKSWTPGCKFAEIDNTGKFIKNFEPIPVSTHLSPEEISEGWIAVGKDD